MVSPLAVYAALDKQQANGLLTSARATEGMNTGWSAPSPREVYHLPASVCQGFASRLLRDGDCWLRLRKEFFCRRPTAFAIQQSKDSVPTRKPEVVV